MEGLRQQMRIHDAGPARLRELVRIHNTVKGVRMYSAEVAAATPKCQHGRLPASCPHCHWEQHKRR
jgi:hypothetical protein